MRFAALHPREVAGIATAPARTVLDCARGLPFDAALAVADSALRAGDVDREELLAAAERSPRTGRSRALRVVRCADGRAANAFESVVRAISLDVQGLACVPQVEVAASITPDLVDVDLRLVVECDSWTYHAEQTAFRCDQERFNELVLDGWRVLRFGYEHAMHSPEYVRRTLQAAVVSSRAEGRAVTSPPGRAGGAG